VSSVKKASPADKGGIEPGDVILKFNGKAINNATELPPLVAELAPGTNAQIEIWRDHQSKTLNVKLGELVSPDDQPTTMSKVEEGKLGLAVRPLSPEEAQKAHVDSGLLVEDVADGPAAEAGIRPGDVLLSVNGKKINSVKQLKDYIDNNQKYMAILVLRGDSKLFVPIEIG